MCILTFEQKQAVKIVLESLLQEPWGSISLYSSTEQENNRLIDKAREYGIELVNPWSKLKTKRL